MLELGRRGACRGAHHRVFEDRQMAVRGAEKQVRRDPDREHGDPHGDASPGRRGPRSQYAAGNQQDRRQDNAEAQEIERAGRQVDSPLRRHQDDESHERGDVSPSRCARHFTRRGH